MYGLVSYSPITSPNLVKINANLQKHTVFKTVGYVNEKNMHFVYV